MSYNPLLEKSNRAQNDSPDGSSFDDHHPLNCASCSSRGPFRRFLPLLSTAGTLILLILTFGLLAFNLFQTSLVKSNVVHEVTHMQYGNDRSYMSLDHKYDHLWVADVKGRGNVTMPLHVGEPATIGRIGMFHQLHCLARFREALQRGRAGEHVGIDDHDDAYWPECFHYMRQALLCTAHDTIERPRFRNGSIGAQWINGQWDVRTCGNSKKLYEMYDQHKVTH